MHLKGRPLMITVRRLSPWRKSRVHQTQSKQECIVAINLLHHTENAMRVIHDNASANWERAKSAKSFSMTDTWMQEIL